MPTTNVYLIASPNTTLSCVRTLLDAGVDPNAIVIHRWDPLFAVRVRAEVPEPAASVLARLCHDAPAAAEREAVTPPMAEVRAHALPAGASPPNGFWRRQRSSRRREIRVD